MPIETFILNTPLPTLFFILLLLLWTMVWKGLALWRAASKGDKTWFVELFIVNNFGILEILYLRIFSKRKDNPVLPAN